MPDYNELGQVYVQGQGWVYPDDLPTTPSVPVYEDPVSELALAFSPKPPSALESFRDSISNVAYGLQHGVLQKGRGYVGVAQSAADLIGGETLASAYDALVRMSGKPPTPSSPLLNKARTWLEEGQEEDAASLVNPGIDYLAGFGAGQIIPAMPLGLSGVAADQALTGYGNAYLDYRDKGLSQADASLAGLGQAGIDAATSLPGVAALKYFKKTAPRAVFGAAVDAPMNVLGTAASMELQESATGEDILADQYNKALQDSAKVAGLQTALTAGVSQPFVRRNYQIPESEIASLGRTLALQDEARLKAESEALRASQPKLPAPGPAPLALPAPETNILPPGTDPIQVPPVAGEGVIALPDEASIIRPVNEPQFPKEKVIIPEQFGSGREPISAMSLSDIETKKLLEQVDANRLNKKTETSVEEATARLSQASAEARSSESGVLKHKWNFARGERGTLRLGAAPESVKKASLDEAIGRAKTLQKTAPNVYKVISQDVGEVERRIAHQVTLARKYPQYEPVVRAARRSVEMPSEIKYDAIVEFGRDYFDLPDKSKVNKLLLALDYEERKNGRHIELTPEIAKQSGFSQKEYNAAQGAQAAMRWAYRQAMEARIDNPATSATEKNRLRSQLEQDVQKNYIPHDREGSFKIDVIDPKTNSLLRSEFFKTKSEMEKATRQISQDPNVTILQGRAGAEPTDFFAQSSFVPGYSTDLEKSINKYISSMADYATRQRIGPQLKAEVEKLKAANLPNLSGAAESLYKDIFEKQSTPLGRALDNIYAYSTFHQLGFAPSSAIVNMFTIPTVGVPKLAQLLQGSNQGALAPEAIYAKAVATAPQYLRMIKKGDRGVRGWGVDQETLDAVRSAQRSGVISDNLVEELTARKGDFNPRESVMDASMWLMSQTEQMARTTAFVAGFEAARRKGLKGQAAFDLAAQHARDVGVDASAANRPEITRGAGKWAAQFKTPWMNQMRIIKELAVGDGVNERSLSGLLRWGAYQTALGGVMSYPFMKDIVSTAQSAGLDPETEMKESIGDALTYGVSVALAPNAPVLSGAVAIGGIPNEVRESVPGAAGALIGGAPMSLFQNLVEATKYPEDRMYERMAPRAVGNIAGAARFAREGIRKPNGELMTPTSGEVLPSTVAQKAIGFMSEEVNNANRGRRAADVEEQSIINARSGYAREFAEAVRAFTLGDRTKGSRFARRLTENHAKYPPGDARRVEIEDFAGSISEELLQRFVTSHPELLSPSKTPSSADKKRRIAEKLEAWNSMRE